MSYFYIAYEALGTSIIMLLQFLAIYSTANNWEIGLNVSWWVLKGRWIFFYSYLIQLLSDIAHGYSYFDRILFLLIYNKLSLHHLMVKLADGCRRWVRKSVDICSHPSPWSWGKVWPHWRPWQCEKCPKGACHASLATPRAFCKGKFDSGTDIPTQ